MRYFIGFLLLIVQSVLYSETVDTYLKDGRYIMEPNVFVVIEKGHFSISYDWDDYYIPKVSGAYYLTEKEGIHYVHIKTSKDSEYVFSVIALDDILFLVDMKTGKTYHASQTITKGQFPVLEPFYNYEASSYLKESYGGKSYKYKPSNLSEWDLMEPWVEGVDGSGIGEWISFSYPAASTSFYIVNGFYDPYRPHLFKKNNRVKNFELIAYDKCDGKLRKKFINTYTLDDTSELQKLVLPEGWTHFKLIIKSVYPGTAYDDTCIAGIFTDIRWGK